MTLLLGNSLDNILGDIQKDTITTIFGPPGVGKSTLCFQYLLKILKVGKKIIYVDTEGGFSPERIAQMADFKVNLQDIIVFSPKSFEEQQKVIVDLNKSIKHSKDIGLVIVDSLVMLYRLKLGGSPQKINSELGEQLRMLTQISRMYHIPILVTNQMYTNFETKENKMVGGSLIEYWSKTIIELEKENNIKYIILKKHKFKPTSTKKEYEITQDLGLVEKKAKFSLFRPN